MPADEASLLVPGPAVPGVRKTNVSGDRKKLCPDANRANGRSLICLSLTTVPISDDSVCSVGASPITVTVSFTSPTCRVMLSEVTLFTWITTPVCSAVLNPVAEVLTL